MEQTPGFLSAPENLPEQKKTIERPPSADYFSNDPEGKKLKKKVLKRLADPEKLFNFQDGQQFRMREYFHAVETKFLLGEPFEEDLEKARAISSSYADDPHGHSVVSGNYYRDLLGLYYDLKIPADTRIDAVVAELKEAPKGKYSLLNSHKDYEKSEHLCKAAILYINSGDFTKASYINEHLIPVPDRVIFLSAFAARIEDPQQSKLAATKALALLFATDPSKRTHEFCDAAQNVAVVLAKQNRMEELQQVLGSITDTSYQISTRLTIAERARTLPDIQEKMRTEALQIARNVDLKAYEKNSNYGRIAAAYANIGEIEQVKEILNLKTKGNNDQIMLFLRGLSPEALKNNEATRKFVIDFLSDETIFTKVHKNLFASSAVKIFSEMGLFEEALSIFPNAKIDPAFKNEEMRSFTNGVNNYLKTKPADLPQINPMAIKFEQLFRSPKQAFFAGYVFGETVAEKTISMPDHVKLAFELGCSYGGDGKKTEFDIGAEHTPQTIRTFFWAMQQYHFEKIPDVLERIFNALPEEGDKAVYDLIATEPAMARRLVKILIEIDENKGTRFAQDLIVRKVTPDRVFAHFARVFIKHRRFTKNLEPFLRDPENIVAVRKLLGQRPNQFNTVLDTLTGIGVTDLAAEEALEQGFEDLEVLTPGIYKKYRSLPPHERKIFADTIKNFDYSNFFKNQSIEGGNLTGDIDKDVMLDLMFRAYNPVNMSYEGVQALLPQVQDRTKDLEGYKFQDSYEVSFKAPNYVLREGEELEKTTVEKIQKVLENAPPDPKIRDEAFLKLIRATTDFTEPEIASLFWVLREKQEVVAAQKTFRGSLGNTAFQDLSSLKELFGVFAIDNFGSAIEEQVEKEGKISKKVEALLSNPERRKNILKALGHQEENEFTKDVPTIALVSQLFADKALSKYNILINKELRKFKLSEGDASVEKKAKVYISKNQGSFFAKAAAGICTASDTELWNMKNHFHINTVDEQNMVKGNTMGYIEDVNGEKSLVLRGFNPTDQYLKDITAESFVEEMLRVARDFKQENTLSHIYLVAGGAGLDSNREQIRKYLESKYFIRLPEIPHEMKLSTAYNVKTLRLLE